MVCYLIASLLPFLQMRIANRRTLTDDLIATKADVEAHFNTHGTGEITEIKLMNGFGFIEYKDAMDARDVVPGMVACSPRIQYT
jgi:hypothetical protein